MEEGMKGDQATCIFVYQASGNALATFAHVISFNSNNFKGQVV